MRKEPTSHSRSFPIFNRGRFGVAILYKPKQIILPDRAIPKRSGQMARMNGLEKMSYSELTQLRTRIDGLMVEKQGAERAALRQKMADMAKDHGLSLDEVPGSGAALGGIRRCQDWSPQWRCGCQCL